jgi:hypothetical protein
MRTHLYLLRAGIGGCDGGPVLGRNVGGVCAVLDRATKVCIVYDSEQRCLLCSRDKLGCCCIERAAMDVLIIRYFNQCMSVQEHI